MSEVSEASNSGSQPAEAAAVAELEALRSRVKVLEELLEVQERTVIEQSERLEDAVRHAVIAGDAKAAFLANMSHEIRTPMNAILGMTGLLVDTQLTLTQQDYLDTIRTSSEHLLTVINDILDYSKIESGMLELERYEFDLRTCLEEAFDLVLAPAGEKGLELAFCVGEGVPAALLGDVGRLRQILVNLLGNAVKFTREGEVVVRVEAERLPEGAWQLEFEVRDTGIGIPPERQGRLFQSFSQVDASNTREFGGTGLGLAISRRLAELMGGGIRVESAPGQGSSFFVTVRAEAVERSIQVSVLRSYRDLEGRRLLVVDDHPVNRRLLEDIAARIKMECASTGEPREALAWVREGREFDLAVLDHQMPGMDGLTLAGELRKLAGGRELPLILLTSLGVVDRSDGLFCALLTKPVKQSRLLDRMRAALPGRQKVSTAPPAPEEDAEALPPMKILVAEDNLTNQKVVRLLLAKLGLDADLVANGEEVLDAVTRVRYDVILMDVQMPVMDGILATKELRRRLPPGDFPRVVALTANVLPEHQDACLEAGMCEFLPKPIRPGELREVLVRLARNMPPRDGAASGDVPASPRVSPGAFEHLLELCGSDIDAMRLVVEEHLRRSLMAVVALRHGHAHQDPAGMREAARRLGEGCRLLGARRLTELCGDFEAALERGVPAELQARVATLDSEYRLMKEELQGYLDEA